MYSLFNPEEAFHILRGRFFDLLHADSVNLGDLLGDLPDIGGFVAFSPVGNRC